MSANESEEFHKISELNPHIKRARIKAVIITKTKPHFFESKGQVKQGVITFTVRDCRTRLCNCKFWGTPERVCEYDEKFRIGHVVIILNPLVVQSNCNDGFSPKATLNMHLIVNEGAGSFVAIDNFQNLPESNSLLELLHISHKPLSHTLRLDDVNRMLNPPWQGMEFLVMVAGMKKAREINSGVDTVRCLEVMVIDQSTAGKGVIFSIWHDQWIERATENWQPMKTVLHLIDVKILASYYHHSNVLRYGPETVIYENPLGREADRLRMFVNNLQPQNLNILLGGYCGDDLPTPEQISTPMTVKQIYARLEGDLQDAAIDNFTAVLYGMVTKFDIDGYASVLSRKCKKCKRLLMQNASSCQSEQCMQLGLSASFSSEPFEYFFNINMRFGDHTGTLVESRLQSPIAERLLGLSVVDFRELSARKDERLEKLKWRFLFNYFQVKLLIKKPNALRRQANIIVIDAKRVTELQTLADTISIF